MPHRRRAGAIILLLSSIIAHGCASRHVTPAPSVEPAADNRELPADLVIEIVSTPHQNAAGHYHFGLSQDGTATLVPMLGATEKWHVSRDAIERSVLVLLEGGLAEVDAVKQSLPNGFLHVGVRLDARRVDKPSPSRH